MAGCALALMLALPLGKVLKISSIGTPEVIRLPKHKAISVSAPTIELTQSPARVSMASCAKTELSAPLTVHTFQPYESFLPEVWTPPPRA